MYVRLTFFISALSLLVSCQHSAQVEETPRTFEKVGGVERDGANASWDEYEVQGPRVAVRRRADGTWAGDIVNQTVDVSIYEGRASGANLVLKWADENGHRVITARVHNQPYRFELYPDRIVVRQPARSFTLGRRGDGTYGPPGGELKLEGDAQSASPRMPQFAIALLATFYDPAQDRP